MDTLLGTSLPVFVGLTVCGMGFASFMTGQGLANTWRPMWQTVVYSVLLGFADRFLTWSLFQGELFHLSGYVIDTLVLLAICSVAYRLTLTHKMVTQYPWIYQRSGPFTWRRKGAD
jgi:hypothetical protein